MLYLQRQKSYFTQETTSHWEQHAENITGAQPYLLLMEEIQIFLPNDSNDSLAYLNISYTLI